MVSNPKALAIFLSGRSYYLSNILMIINNAFTDNFIDFQFKNLTSRII